MNPSFAQALQAGTIEAAILWDGSPFIVDNVQYYRAVNKGKNLTLGRFHEMADTLLRHDALKVSTGLMNSYLDSMEMLSRRISAQASLNVEQVIDASGEIMTLTSRMRTRMAVGLSTEQVYEIASIWYFSDQEDPSRIDHAINEAKIRSWADWDKADLLYDYLLRQPMGAYIPQEELSDESMLNYIQIANQQELLDLTRLFIKLGANTNPHLRTILNNRRETLYALTNALVLSTGPQGLLVAETATAELASELQGDWTGIGNAKMDESPAE